MQAAVLLAKGAAPRIDDFADPDPEPGRGEVVVDVTAAGVHHADLAKAAGAFGEPEIPCVVGTDGVGRVEGGRRVFFDSPVAPYGSYSQRTLVPEENLLEVAEGVDDVTAAALGNTGLAAWCALSWSANVQPGESVLVLGASGSVGTVAVQAAKALGAAHVIAADRDPDRLRRARDRGADATVLLGATDLSAAFREAAGAHGINVIIDPLWGEPALSALQAASPGARHIEIGDSAGATMTLPATLMRRAGLRIIGFSIFDVPLQERRAAYRDLTEHVAQGTISIDTITVPLADVADAWERQKQGPPANLVLTP